MRISLLNLAFEVEVNKIGQLRELNEASRE